MIGSAGVYDTSRREIVSSKKARAPYSVLNHLDRRMMIFVNEKDRIEIMKLMEMTLKSIPYKYIG